MEEDEEEGGEEEQQQQERRQEAKTAGPGEHRRATSSDLRYPCPVEAFMEGCLADLRQQVPEGYVPKVRAVRPVS